MRPHSLINLCFAKFWLAGEIAFLASSALAQIVPDATLPTPSSVTQQGNTTLIERGTNSGNNLFHSFREFSIPTGTEAFFNNGIEIQNIFTRVTGGLISTIDGTLRVNGSANLFLLNPNGIIFGPHAQLNLNGSFLASTASNLYFADGTSFSTTPAQATPLLTVSVPIGLQLEPNSGSIRVQGTGHNLSVENPVFSPITRNVNLTGLQVQPGQNLALIGGEITLEGSTLTAESGRIELGAIASGRVSLNAMPTGWIFNYESVPSFKDIHLSQRALVDSSGNGGGAISLQGKRIAIADGSVLLMQNQGTLPGGNISVHASDVLDVIGTSPDIRIRSGLLNETVGAGNGGEISVSTQRLIIEGGGQMSTRTFSAASAGNLTVNASESVQAIGVAPLNPGIFSRILAITFGSGAAGNLALSTGRLIVLNGASVGSISFGSGFGGDVTVNATESIELMGVEPTLVRPGGLAAATFNRGDAGSLTINTSRLIVRDGGRVSSSTLASGPAGSVTINASEFVEVSGTVPGAVNPSLIDSSANLTNDVFQQFLNLPPKPSGASGDLTINTPSLRVTQGALVNVRNDGSGDAGTLRINAGSILLDRQGGITAATQSGEGGNIILQVRDFLQMRRSSQISAEAGGAGKGGNLTINANVIAALENSDIDANAVQGQGGSIQIRTQGIFGSQVRPVQTPASDITASSQLGLAGVVAINTPNLDPSSGLVELPSEVLDTERQITQSCAAEAGDEFVITGRGGLPANPTSVLSSDAIWGDFRLPTGSRQSERGRGKEQSSFSSLTPHSLPLVEAQGWVRNGNGEVVLTTMPRNAIAQRPWQTPPWCQ